MRIIALIDDADVVERILRHLKVWDPIPDPISPAGPDPHSIAPDLEQEMRDYIREDVALLAQLLRMDLFEKWNWQ